MASSCDGRPKAPTSEPRDRHQGGSLGDPPRLALVLIDNDIADTSQARNEVFYETYCYITGISLACYEPKGTDY